MFRKPTLNRSSHHQQTEPVKIVLANDVTFFGNPEEANPVTLYGQIQSTQRALDEFMGRRILIRVNGDMKVIWDEECSYFAILASQKNLLNQSQILSTHPDTSSCPPYDSGMISPLPSEYLHTFPFQFSLDGHLPSSFSNGGDEISYSVDLILVKEDDSDKEEILYTCPFKVNRCLLPSLHHSLPSTTTTDTHELNYTSHHVTPTPIIPTTPSPFLPGTQDKWMGTFEGIQYQIVAPPYLLLGQPHYEFKLSLSSPHPHITSAHVTTSLKQVVQCQLDTFGAPCHPTAFPHNFQKCHEHTITKSTGKRKISNTDTDLLIRLPLHPTRLTESIDGDLITTTHHLKFTLKTTRFTNRKLHLTIPVLVTSPPDCPPPYLATLNPTTTSSPLEPTLPSTPTPTTPRPTSLLCN